MNECPVLIDMLECQQSNLGFVVIAVNVLYNTSVPNIVTLQANFDLLD